MKSLVKRQTCGTRSILRKEACPRLGAVAWHRNQLQLSCVCVAFTTTVKVTPWRAVPVYRRLYHRFLLYRHRPIRPKNTITAFANNLPPYGNTAEQILPIFFITTYVKFFSAYERNTSYRKNTGTAELHCRRKYAHLTICCRV